MNIRNYTKNFILLATFAVANFENRSKEKLIKVYIDQFFNLLIL